MKTMNWVDSKSQSEQFQYTVFICFCNTIIFVVL